MRILAFITGSHAYGTPHEDSDFDLCVLVSSELKETLEDLRDPTDSMRFGRLNLICFDRWEDFSNWERVTEDLVKRKPVTREEAIQAFQDAGFGEGY